MHNIRMFFVGTWGFVTQNMGMLLLRTWGCCYFPSIVFSIIKG